RVPALHTLPTRRSTDLAAGAGADATGLHRHGVPRAADAPDLAEGLGADPPAQARIPGPRHRHDREPGESPGTADRRSAGGGAARSVEHTSEIQSPYDLV